MQLYGVSQNLYNQPIQGYGSNAGVGALKGYQSTATTLPTGLQAMQVGVPANSPVNASYSASANSLGAVVSFVKHINDSLQAAFNNILQGVLQFVGLASPNAGATGASSLIGDTAGGDMSSMLRTIDPAVTVQSAGSSTRASDTTASAEKPGLLPTVVGEIFTAGTESWNSEDSFFSNLGNVLSAGFGVLRQHSGEILNSLGGSLGGLLGGLFKR